MRGARSVGVLGAVLLAGLLGACQQAPGTSGERPGGGDGGGSGEGGAGGGGGATPSGFGAVFLDLGECGSRGPAPTEVSCTSEKARAKVIARHENPRREGARGTNCPAGTDFVLHVSGSPGVRGGYACMRNLEPPHPGDPGGGGGPHTVVGDCLYDAAAGEVRETSCDGSGTHRPRYRLTSTASDRAACPPATALYVELAGARPVGCARPV